MDFNKSEKLKEKVIEEIKVENIPFCVECLLDNYKGCFICNQCKINLCNSHAIEHMKKNEDHKYLLLKK